MATLKLTLCVLAMMVATASATACESYPAGCTSSDCRACVEANGCDATIASYCNTCQYKGGSVCFNCVKDALNDNKAKCTECNGDSLCTTCVSSIQSTSSKTADNCLSCKTNGGSLCFQCLDNTYVTSKADCITCNGNSLCYSCVASSAVGDKTLCNPTNAAGCQGASDCIECLKSPDAISEASCIGCRTKGGSVCYNCVQSSSTDANHEAACVAANGDSVKINAIING